MKNKEKKETTLNTNIYAEYDTIGGLIRVEIEKNNQNNLVFPKK